jgi:hypothetical protein
MVCETRSLLARHGPAKRWGRCCAVYLFQRTITLRGGARKPIAWAIEMNKLVNDLGGVEVGLWSSVFGFPLGTVVWSARVDSRAALAEVTGKLMANDEYHSLVKKGQKFVDAPGQDTLRQLVHAESLSPTPPPVGAAATVITATANPGQIAKALAWGVEITTIYSRITGSPASFFADAYGPFGQLTWITTHADIAAADAANDALQATPDYLTSIDGAGALFVPGSGMQALATRIA